MSGNYFGVLGVGAAAGRVLAPDDMTVVLLAGYVPARRATRVDPMVALRIE